MSANFTPNMGEYNPTGSFKFWCQKVLPLVYDDSLSYYETLCKVTNYLNDVIKNSDTLNENVNGLYNAYIQLQDYVNNYFNNVDFPNLVNEKLDTMASDGSLSALIQPLFDEYKVTIDNTVNTQNNEINVLKSRMDTFTSLPDGSTTGDAELQDIRVGANGEIYPSAGNAVRGQVSDLNSDLVDLFPMTEITMAMNKYCNANNGVIMDIGKNGEYRCSNYIEVYTDKIALYNKNCDYDSQNDGYAFYDENKVFINGGRNPVTEQTLKIIDVPFNAKYFVYCDWNNTQTSKVFPYNAFNSNGINFIKNLFPKFDFTLTDNQYVDYRDGHWFTIGDNNQCSSSDIPICCSKIALFNNDANVQSGDVAGYAFYDENYMFISGGRNPNSSPKLIIIDVPKNARHFVFSQYNYNKNYKKEVFVIPLDIESRLIDIQKQADISRDITSTISMFDTIGCCGDSFTAGLIYVGDTEIGEVTKISWGKQLERMSGVISTNYAKSGATTETFLTNEDCLPKLLSDTPKDLYVLCLGINDSGHITLGSVSDINDDYTQNPNTFYGNYGRIIAQIKNHAPNSMIIISKCWLTNAYGSNFYNYSSTAIEEIANKFGIPFIDTAKSDLLNSYYYTKNMVHTHPTAPLYGMMAKAMNKMIDECIVKNLWYFKTYH